MVIGLVFLTLFLLLLALLFIPIEVYLNTITHQYYVQIRGLAKASIESDDEEFLRIRIKVFFRNFYFYPLQRIGVVKRRKPEVKVLKQRKKNSNQKKVLRLLKSFRVKTIYVNVDTGDYITNANLYPVFTLLNYHKGNFNINFEGSNQLVLCIQNRPIYIIKSFINF